MPTTPAESMIVYLWVSLWAIKPENTMARPLPKDKSKNSPPACVWLREKSFSMLTKKGAEMSLERKLKKKTQVSSIRDKENPNRDEKLFFCVDIN